jgi:HD-GYP domain-containing protein (c-di-GMP phosphodiesterase class II)
VYLDETSLLVPAWVEIRQKDIDRLEKWNIDVVLTDGIPATGEQQQDDPDALLPVLEEMEEAEEPHLYVRSVAQTNRLYSDIGAGSAINVAEIDSICDALIAGTSAASDEMLSFVLKAERANPSIGLSAVNTVILSVLVGQTLHMDAAGLKRLAIAALLHDVGMMRVPQEIVNRPRT